MADLALQPAKRLDAAAALDLAERVTLTVLFVRMAMINAAVIAKPGHWFNVLLLVSEGLCVLLVLIRHKSSDVSPRFRDWLLAFAATIGPLLVSPTGARSLIPVQLGVVLLCTGVMTQLSAKVILGRSFGLVPANRGVKVDGPYRFVRHPMYLGYITVQVGFMLLAPNLLNLCIYLASFSLQVGRLLAEERLLSRDPAYAAFMTRTCWRLLPGVFCPPPGAPWRRRRERSKCAGRPCGCGGTGRRTGFRFQRRKA